MNEEQLKSRITNEERLKARMETIVGELHRTGLVAFYNYSTAGETVTSCLVCLDRNDPLGLPLVACRDSSGRLKLGAISWMTMIHGMTYGCAMEPDWKVVDDEHPFGSLDKTHYVTLVHIDYTKINCDFDSPAHLLKVLQRQRTVIVYPKEGQCEVIASGTMWFDNDTGKSYLLGSSNNGIQFNCSAIPIRLQSGMIVTEPTQCRPTVARLIRLPSMVKDMSENVMYFDYREGAGERNDPQSLLNPDNAFMAAVKEQGGLTVLRTDSSGITHYETLSAFVVVQRAESNAVVLLIRADPNDIVRTIFSFIEMSEYTGLIVNCQGDGAFVMNLPHERVADAALLGNYIKSKQPVLAGPVFRFMDGIWIQLQ